ncbi:hypothetical protein I79_025999 [Cricetulus griseus]|uniref:Uncharacterized protein n=1 Tax=Cricetulus griseus TaxID=10029 RepID=G3IPS4_CRIGR|nr:hypothetical protein I79_025999 [Cricetulus griseus]
MARDSEGVRIKLLSDKLYEFGYSTRSAYASIASQRKWLNCVLPSHGSTDILGSTDSGSVTRNQTSLTLPPNGWVGI